MSQIYALREMARSFKREEGDRLLFPMHAVRLLCAAQKDRGSDEAKAWMKVTIPHTPPPPRRLVRQNLHPVDPSCPFLVHTS